MNSVKICVRWWIGARWWARVFGILVVVGMMSGWGVGVVMTGRHIHTQFGASSGAMLEQHAAMMTHGFYWLREQSGAQLSSDAYVPPALAARMTNLRPLILASAARHNREDLSGMSDREFAEVIVLVLYNEHNGWVEDAIEPLRVVTPFYQDAQRVVNQWGIGSNFSVWPANMRPSVAVEILRHEVPLPDGAGVMTVPLVVEGSRIVLTDYETTEKLFAAVSSEICRDDLAIEYLAANLARGVYRAHYEGVAVTWQTLAAWHNQGIVRPEEIEQNLYARDYVFRTSMYVPLAKAFLADTDSKH